MDNNVCDRALKKAILHRKNSLFFKTKNGACVGDICMSLLHTAELSEEDPFDYLVAVMRNPRRVRNRPRNGMPWNYRETLVSLTSRLCFSKSCSEIPFPLATKG
ncbi:MAG: hypothetical protein D6679_06750, partial [Candidatus Hydrogenedentota bacterium]